MSLESDWTPSKVYRPENTTFEELQEAQKKYNRSLLTLGTQSPFQQYNEILPCEPGSDVVGVKLDNGGQ